MKEQFFPQPSVTDRQGHFAKVPRADIQRSKFDRSHGLKTTFDGGLLIPIFLDEVMPGDTFDLKQTSFARLATPLKPFMDNLKLETHFWFIPNRLVWDNWAQFMGERPDPDDDPGDFSIPQVLVNLATLTPSDLAAYFGLPINPAAVAPVSVSALPFRAYNLVWNEWYRDQNLQDRIPVSKGDGPDNIADYSVKRRGKRHDYFTSCLPWPQKGDPVLLPLGGQAPVVMDNLYTADVYDVRGRFDDENWGVLEAFTAGSGNPATLRSFTTPAGGATGDDLKLRGTAEYVGDDPYADLTEATATTINDLRTAFQIQRLLERDARGGTRYTEIILSHFGVQSDDARLQRPEYLGGDSSNINVNPIASTAQTTSLPQGNLSAVGTTVNRSGFQKSFTEHGYIIGVVSARADLNYQNGIERSWSRQTRYDYYWPALAHLGEQAVLNKEIYASGAAADDQVFGYQERYGDLRYKPSRVTGLFHSNASGSLDSWHLAQDFATLPVLNASFIEDTPPIDRVIAVTSEPHFLMDVWFQLECDRPMPVYSVPGLIDHF